LIARLALAVQGSNGGDSLAVIGSKVYVANNAAGNVTVISDCPR
jgi:hypothetical protein